MTLETLLLAAGLGDELAFAELDTQLRPRLFGLILQTLRDVHQAEEVTQEVLFEIWNSAGGFDPGKGSALSWAFTMARRRAIDRVRYTEAWRRRDTRAVAAERFRPARFDDTADQAEAAVTAQLVRTALQVLSDRQREALQLAYLDGHTFLDVARLLQVPPGTAKSRLNAGLTKLRDLLGHEAVSV